MTIVPERFVSTVVGYGDSVKDVKIGIVVVVGGKVVETGVKLKPPIPVSQILTVDPNSTVVKQVVVVKGIGNREIGSIVQLIVVTNSAVVGRHDETRFEFIRRSNH